MSAQRWARAAHPYRVARTDSGRWQVIRRFDLGWPLTGSVWLPWGWPLASHTAAMTEAACLAADLPRTPANSRQADYTLRA